MCGRENTPGAVTLVRDEKDGRFLAVTHGRVLVAIHLSIFRPRILQFGMAKAFVNGF
jgi:hypothetical protein